MSKKEVIKQEVLESELAGLRMMRKRSAEDALRAAVIAERELELEAEIQELKKSAA